MRITLLVIITLLCLNVAGFMAFDGTRALAVGDYVTPKRGKYAGQLGPWSHLVQRVGIDPRSTLMKSIFAIYGYAWLAILVCFLLKMEWAWAAMFAAAAGALWYLPFGTLCSILIMAILLLPVVRTPPSG